MYYPYIFGRQYDLLALDAVAKKIATKQVVIPIIEPVSINPRDASKTIRILLKQSIPTIVVLNPNLGSFKGASAKDSATWNAEILTYAGDQNFIPAFKITTSTSFAEIKSFLSTFTGSVALIHWAQLDEVTLSAHLKTDSRRITNVYTAQHTSSSYRQSLPGRVKVLARDGFTRAERNADYVADEFFDDLILTYKSKEKMDGFSDFTITGAVFKAGGGQAAAVATHLSYEKQSNNEIWIRHFVSDDVTIPPIPVNPKIGQSLKKLNAFVQANHTLFSFSVAVTKFQAILTTGATTSLAKLKQFSIEHHVELMDHLL